MAMAGNNRIKPNLIQNRQQNTTISNINNRRVNINQLNQSLHQTIIVGVVIVKNDVKAIVNRKGTETNLLCLTVRDSPRDSINVSCWGSIDFVQGLSSSFGIGDVVMIKNAQIQLQQVNANNAQYKPDVSSEYQLTLSEHFSSLDLYEGDSTCFSSLMHVPLKPGSPLVTIEEIRQGQEQFRGQHATILVAIKKVGQIRELTSKMGKQLKKCDVAAFDQTCSNFNITIWDSEWMLFAQSWTPRDCVILAQDVKLNYDEYRKAMGATVDGKTVFTLNPDIREAHVLSTFIQTVILEDESNDVNLEAIRDQYTIQGLKEALLTDGRKGENVKGILYACLNHLDLDGPCTPCVAKRCSCCHQTLDQALEQCDNLECPAGCGLEMTTPSQQLDLQVSLTDHTGTLDRCRLAGAVAEAFLRCSVSDFLQLSPVQKTALKWQFLLERSKWYFQAKLQNGGKFIGVQILNGEKSDVGEWCTKGS